MSIVFAIITICIGAWLGSTGGAFDTMAGVMLVIVGANVAALGAENAVTRNQLTKLEQAIKSKGK